MKFENTLRNKLLFFWVSLSLLISAFYGIYIFYKFWDSSYPVKVYNFVEGIEVFIGALIVTSPPVILQLFYNNHFKNKKVKKTLRNMLLLIWVILTVTFFMLAGLRSIVYTDWESAWFLFLTSLFFTSIQLIFNYLFRE